PVVGVDVGEVGARQDADDALDPLGTGGVDRDDAPVRDRAAQHAPVEHAREEEVAGELRLSAQLLARIAAWSRDADLRAGRRLPDGRGHAMPASSATASTMPRYPVQRQRLPARLRLISSSLSSSPLSSSELTVSSMPGVQKPHWSAACR